MRRNLGGCPLIIALDHYNNDTTRYRLYCANKPCGEYLHRQNYHVLDDISCAKCDRCNTYTCTYCKNSIHEKETCQLCANNEWPHAIMEHECVLSETDRQFKDAVKENGYQECYTCGSTVELSEACNHMTCACGCEFCYVCGKPWKGYHACPRYGAPVYDDEGYNQDGFHRDTGMDRDGNTRGRRDAEEEDEEDEEDDQEDEDEEENEEEDEDEEGGEEEGDEGQEQDPGQAHGLHEKQCYGGSDGNTRVSQGKEQIRRRSEDGE